MVTAFEAELGKQADAARPRAVLRSRLRSDRFGRDLGLIGFARVKRVFLALEPGGAPSYCYMLFTV
ncbi:hypothetical protein WL98_06360 [Burkholderia multivorans]|nr:hypothetical protein WL98_06360 [Burkholderia multivorans]